MANIAFVSLDKVKRLVTYTVNGEDVTRHIPEQFEGSIDKYLLALENGLHVEFDALEVEPKPIDEPSIKVGESLSVARVEESAVPVAKVK